MKTKHLLLLGYLIPLIFWATTFVCGLILGDYNHLSRMVSELGELGTKTQYLFTVGLVLCSLLNIFFVFGLYKTCKKHKFNTIPVLIILLYSFLAGPAIFPFPMKMHGIVGIPFVFVVLSPLLALFLWKKQLPSFKLITTLSFLIILLGFLILVPEVLNDYFGLKQRFLYTGYSVWFCYLSYSFTNIQKHNLT